MKILPGKGRRSKNIEDIRAYFGTQSIRKSRGRVDDINQFFNESISMGVNNKRPPTNMKYTTNKKFKTGK